MPIIIIPFDITNVVGHNGITLNAGIGVGNRWSRNYYSSAVLLEYSIIISAVPKYCSI